MNDDVRSKALAERLLAPSGALAAIGDTPLVPLMQLPASASHRLYGKLEGLNPAGSSKDRPALAMIRQGIEDGLIGPDTVIIESSSGNMAIGLAQVCASLGLRLICVVDKKTAKANVRLIQLYGAQAEVVMEPDPATGELLPARLTRVRELQDAIPDTFWTNQYTNLENAGSHTRSTMPEIAKALNGVVDWLFCPTGTFGLLRGCAEYVRSQGMSTTIVGVDAAGSLIFDSSTAGATRRLPGLGAAVRPPLFDATLFDRVAHVSDADCVAGCRELVRREGLLLGASSGGVLAAMVRLVPEIPVGSIVVGIFPDRGERYLDTVFDDAWVTEHLGAVPPMWPA
jgi:cysteine synthase A